MQQTPYRSARRAQAAHGPKKDAPLQQCRNSSAHTSTEDARAGWASAQTTINYARLGSRAKARARTWCRPRRSPDSTTGKATTPSRPFSTHSACAHMHPRKPRRREAHTVIDTGSIGSRARHHVTGWGLPILVAVKKESIYDDDRWILFTERQRAKT